MHQPLSAPKSAADLHAAPPPAARATTTCPEELDPTAVAPPSQRSPCMVLRRPLESAEDLSIAVRGLPLQPAGRDRARALARWRRRAQSRLDPGFLLHERVEEFGPHLGPGGT